MANERKAKESQHLRNYREYMHQYQLLNIRFRKESKLKYVTVSDILPIVYSHPYWNENTPNFWYHHSRTPKEYDDFATKYQNIREKMCEGVSLYALKRDKNFRLALERWWNKSDPVSLVGFKSSYFAVSGFHRIALSMKHNIAEIPAVVSEARLKRKSNAGKCS